MGVAKLAEAAMAMVIKKGFGSTPNCSAAERAIGNTRAAAALFVIISVNIAVIKYNAAKTPTGPKPCENFMVVRAIDSAVPEFNMALLMAKAHAMVIKTSQLMAFVYFC